MSDMQWFSSFLVQTTGAENVTALSSIVTKQLAQVMPFTYVSVFFIGYDSNLYLTHEAGNTIRNASLFEISLNAISCIHEWPCTLNKLVSNKDHERDTFAFKTIEDLLCEPIKSTRGIVSMLCYRLGSEEIPDSKRIILDLAALQIALSFDRIIKEQRMMYGSTCQTHESGEIEKVMPQTDRESCMAEMALGVADGIRNPITVIGGLLKRISKRIDFNHNLQKDWDILLQEAERLERFVKDFEDLAHKREIIFELTDINGVIERSVEVFKNEFLRGGKTEFQLNLMESPCMVKIDEELFSTVLTNLFINALEATGEGGEISISTSSTNGQVVVNVKDNGGGITQEFSNRIFDPFLSTKPGGTGLGLTYVQQIVKEHQGEVKIESQEGHGTSVTISLPENKDLRIKEKAEA